MGTKSMARKLKSLKPMTNRARDQDRDDLPAPSAVAARVRSEAEVEARREAAAEVRNEEAAARSAAEAEV